MKNSEIVFLNSGAAWLECSWVSPEKLFFHLAQDKFSLWLDSSDAPSKNGRYSFIMAEPFQEIVFQDCFKEGQAIDVFSQIDAALNLGREIWSELSDHFLDTLPPFRGGVAGVFSYDLAAILEPLPAAQKPYAIDDAFFPKLSVGVYDSVVAFDHFQKKLYIFSTGLPACRVTTRQQRAGAEILKWKKKLDNAASELIPSPPSVMGNISSAGFTADRYRQSVQLMIEHILSGDIFQANLSQRFKFDIDSEPFSYYRQLRQHNQAPFSCFAQYGEWSLASASPERFLSLNRAAVCAKPIKGTQARSSLEKQDQLMKELLLKSEKDRAENIMIVDLLRNDLAKVCTPDSIVVSNLCAVETFANVHHLVSEIQGRLSPQMGALDLLKASFPGGSITGAPKIRAMELIAKYEPNVRGPYCGCVGYISFDAVMDMNIVIRTALFRQQHGSFQVGGGITLGSDPHQEYEETLNKAIGLLTAMNLNCSDLMT